jgi:hypothetical protein
MQARYRRLLLALCLSLGAHGLASAQGVPAYLLDQRGCGLLVDGSIGSTFADAQVASMWQTINKAIGEHLQDYLQQAKVKSQRLTVAVSQGPDAASLVMEALAQHRCNRVVQIANDVGENAQGRYFGFVVSVIRMVPSSEPAGEGVVNTTARSEFAKTYRFPRTQEAFDAFYTGEFAFKVYEDLAASGALDAMR